MAFGSELEGRVYKEVVASSGGPYTSGMIALVPSERDAARLVVPDGLPEIDLHVTMTFLGEADQYDGELRDTIKHAMQNASNNYEAITGNAFSLSMFNPTGDSACWVLGIGGEEIDDIHNSVWESLLSYVEDFDVIPEQHRPWVSHLTLTYSNDFSLINNLSDRLGPITFDRLRIAFAENEVFDIIL